MKWSGSQPHQSWHSDQSGTLYTITSSQITPALWINELRLNMMRERAEKVVSLDDNAPVGHENVTG